MRIACSLQSLSLNGHISYEEIIIFHLNANSNALSSVNPQFNVGIQMTFSVLKHETALKLGNIFFSSGAKGVTS